jgi:phosphoribosyl 1,2-cyclic phosphodiesterase
VRLTIWGCRGSVPAPGAETVEYGGNTSCVEVQLGDDGAGLVFDAGTGVRELGDELLARGTTRIHLFLTHLHLDHLEGLRFFAPLWQKDVTIDVWGPPSTVQSLEERIRRSFSPPLFPGDLRELPSHVTFRDVPREPWTVEGLSLTAALVLHPGPTVAYRIEADGSTVAYIPDHEPALAGIRGRTIDWISGASIAAEADLLLHDAQYSEEEYEERIGWGHSSVADTVEFSRVVGARRLVLFHHEPRHADEVLQRLEAHAQELAGGDQEPPRSAHEGMVLELT